jgi:hypothetical protein
MSTPPRQALETARAALEGARKKTAQLQDIDPYLIDLSLRENPFGSCVGQTREDKWAVLQRMRSFGFTNILLGTLDYSMPEELEVDDDFMMFLRDNHKDMLTGGFAFTDVGALNEGFAPSPSMIKLQSYGVPNTLHEIYLTPSSARPYSIPQLKEILPASVGWLNDHIVGDGGGKPRIVINIVDGCDAFYGYPDETFDVLRLLATLPIEGVSIEDDRGTYMPFQVGAFVQAARALLPPPLKILVHMHAGGGFENASLIEALLSGADGCWGGLPKRAAIIGHASLGELIANLVRVGNPNMNRYALGNLLPLATWLQELDDKAARVPDDLPILGANAYRLTLGFFEQKEVGRNMDLPPTAIGGTYGYRIAPLGSDAPVIAGRLAEVWPTRPASWFPPVVLTMMIRLMRRELRAGQRIRYDDEEQLKALYFRAGGPPP